MEKSLREGLKKNLVAHNINENKKKNGKLEMVVLSPATTQKTYYICLIGAYLQFMQ